jgi:thiosulfate reductase cytochrome b subunit
MLYIHAVNRCEYEVKLTRHLGNLVEDKQIAATSTDNVFTFITPSLWNISNHTILFFEISPAITPHFYRDIKKYYIRHLFWDMIPYDDFLIQWTFV